MCLNVLPEVQQHQQAPACPKPCRGQQWVNWQAGHPTSACTRLPTCPLASPAFSSMSREHFAQYSMTRQGGSVQAPRYRQTAGGQVGRWGGWVGGGFNFECWKQNWPAGERMHPARVAGRYQGISTKACWPPGKTPGLPPPPPSPLHFTNKPRRSTASFTTQARTHRLGGAACS